MQGNFVFSFVEADKLPTTRDTNIQHAKPEIHFFCFLISHLENYPRLQMSIHPFIYEHSGAFFTRKKIGIYHFVSCRLSKHTKQQLFASPNFYCPYNFWLPSLIPTISNHKDARNPTPHRKEISNTFHHAFSINHFFSN